MILSNALNTVSQELTTYIRSVEPELNEDIVVLGNIAMLETNGNGGDTQIEQRIVLSLVNIEEEKRLKNTPPYKKQNGDVEFVHPPVYINLYLLFSANFDNYNNALIRLSRVIEFFQGKRYFTAKNSPNMEGNLELHMEIHTLNFEQINDLWGSLGGKQVPFVMYKMRVLEVERPSVRAISGVIEDISGSETLN